MSRVGNEFDEEEEKEDDDDMLDERDEPLESDLDDGEDDATSACPYCGRAVFEQAEICPHCRNFISFEDSPRRHARWIWAAVILGLISMLWWIL
jgi:predicted nucleic acid-binding Zn ribbon protein